MRTVLAAILILLFSAASPAYAITQSAAIDGSSKYFTIASTAALSPSSGVLSIEGWVKMPTLPASDGDCITVAELWNGVNATDSYWFALRNISGVQNLGIITRNDPTQSSSQVTWSPTTNKWWYIAVVINGSTAKYYVGDETTSPSQQGANQSSTGPAAVTSKFWLGSNAGHAGEVGCNNATASASMSVVRVWNTDRSASLAGSYCTVLGSGTGLLGEWTLDNTTSDNSGNGNTLTNNGTTGFTADVPSCFSAVAAIRASILSFIRAFWY